jgi:hypothetical protein
MKENKEMAESIIEIEFGILWDKKAVTSDRTLLLRQRVAFLGNRKVLTSETIACLREGVILP